MAAAKSSFDFTTDVGGKNQTHLEMKPDAGSRTIWLCADGRIFVETFSSMYQQACDFLIAIAEPVCRPHFIHQFQLTAFSLYAAVSIGLQTATILEVLDRLAKNVLPPEVIQYIEQMTGTFGKAKLVLEKNKYYVECANREMMTSSVLSDAYIRMDNEAPQPADENDYDEIDKDANDAVQAIIHREEGRLAYRNQVRFQIHPQMVEAVKRECTRIRFPLREEYDYQADASLPTMPMELKSSTLSRSYQEKSLHKMFANGRARSGVIVLPCGAGKTLVGVTACARLHKSCIVIATTAVSCEQWKYQFTLWTNVKPDDIIVFTSDNKKSLPDPKEACVVITTYGMIAKTGRRAEESQKIIDQITSREWGMLVLDEVHVAPAQMFRRITDEIVKAHCKLGLTATLVREDELIVDINYLVGPKLYEANWRDLTLQGFLANVQCCEVWCKMTAEFYREYLRQETDGIKRLLGVCNPNKFRACDYLIRYHEARGDRILVFSDILYPLEKYAKLLKKLFICGSTSNAERMQVLDLFRHSNEHRCIFLSKVGDTSIDLPEANVIIQISSHFGSRRQEAQRLGRILRPKPRKNSEFNAYFYTLVSLDTDEMYYSAKRQQFLIDQGFAFTAMQDVPPEKDTPANLVYSYREEQRKLLDEVLATDPANAAEEIIPDKEFDLPPVATSSVPMGGSFGQVLPAIRRSVGLAGLSGAAGAPPAKRPAPIKSQPLFDKLYKRK